MPKYEQVPGQADWWATPKAKIGGHSKLAAAVTGTAAWLWDQDAPRRDAWQSSLRRFSGSGLRGLFPYAANAKTLDNVRMNVTKAAVETLVSKVGSNRPRPRLLTSGADHSLRRRVKQLQRFLDGVYQATDSHSIAKDCFRDAMLGGTGVAHVTYNLGKQALVLERVFPPELLVDAVEGVNGAPLNYFRVKFMDRNSLAAMFPKLRDYIMDLAPAHDDDLPELDVSDQGGARTQTMVAVYEAWHMATYSHDGDLTCGRHVMCAGDVTFIDEDWDHDFPPFSFFHWTKPVRGFWGDSAVSEIAGIEREMNTLLQKVQRCMKLAGQPWAVVSRQAKFKPGKLTDEAMLLVEYDGQVPPTIQVHQPVHPALIQQIWSLKAAAFEQLGTNEQQAAAIKPPGIESGRALEQLSEEHLVRFKSTSQDYERFVACDLTRQFVRAAKDLDAALKARGKAGYVVKAKSGRTRLDIKWADADVSPDDLIVEVWPVSILPNSPSGKTAEVERWQQNGWISPQRAMSLIELPDLESETDLATADSELVEHQIEQMFDRGEETLPLEVQNLDYAAQRVTFAMEKGVVDGIPQDHLDLGLVYLDALQAMKAPPAPPVDPMAGGLMTQGQPLAGPTGPLPMAPVGGAPPPMPQ